jgi:hypothetical protein
LGQRPKTGTELEKLSLKGAVNLAVLAERTIFTSSKKVNVHLISDQ